MIKLFFISLSMFFLFGCSNTEETKAEQFGRLIKLSEKKMEKERKAKEIENQSLQKLKEQEEQNREEIEVKEIQKENNETKKAIKVDSHVGKTKGEIMVYEMEKISSEMNVLQENIGQYKEVRDNLKAYQEKLDSLERRNKAGLGK